VRIPHPGKGFPTERPLKVRCRRPIPHEEKVGKEATPMAKYRRLMSSLGWLAALVMAVGAGWKTN